MKNIYIFIMIALAVVVGGYFFLQLTSENTDVEPRSAAEEHAPAGVQISENSDGTHIMGDGSVMRGSGEVIVDAVILPDGNIQLPDGRIIEPAFDLR